MKISFHKNSVFHPFLFAVFPVIFLISYNAHLLLPQEIVIPSMAILTAVFVIWIALSRVLKNRRKAGLIVSLGTVLFFSYGHSYNLVKGLEIGEFLVGRGVIIAPMFIIIFVVGTIYFTLTKRKLDNATIITNVIAISLIMIVSVNFFTYYFERESSLNIMNEVEKELQTNISKTEKLPNIYYIILDAYAGDDILQEQLDFDNHEFNSFLTNKGFFVATNSHSNYQITKLSIASSLNMIYFDHSPEKEISKEEIAYKNLISDNKLMNYLKSQGYTTINISSGFPLTQKLDAADFNLCLKSMYVNSEFLIMLVSTSMLKTVSSNLFEQRSREIILCSFSELSKIHQKFESPVFVFAHILLPHPPYFFGPNGEPINPEELSLDLWDKKGYLNNIKFANKKITEFIEEILSNNNNPPIIIIQGDHGSAFTVDMKNLTKEMMKERSSILNAYYFPGTPQSLLYDSITPVNSFRVVLNAHFDKNVILLEDRIYMHRTNKNVYVFEDVTDYVMN